MAEASARKTKGRGRKCATEPGPPSKAAAEPGPPSKAAVEPGPPSKAAAEPGPPSKAAAEPGPPSKAAKERVTRVTRPGRKVELWSQPGVNRKASDVLDLDIDLEIINDLEDSLRQESFPSHCVQAGSRFFGLVRKELRSAISGAETVKEKEKRVRSLKANIRDLKEELQNAQDRVVRLQQRVGRVDGGLRHTLELSQWMSKCEGLLQRWHKQRSLHAPSVDQKLLLVGDPVLVSAARGFVNQV